MSQPPPDPPPPPPPETDQDQAEKNRPFVYNKLEALVREMQDVENGVPVRSQKLFLTSIPAAFMGYDLIEWLMERLSIEESEALNLANQMCLNGYFFPVSDTKNLTVKDDSSLYRFQSAYFWPWKEKTPDNIEYAIYLAKRALRNKQRHALEDYEVEALASLRKNLQNKWEFITLQAEEQVRKGKLAKEKKKGDKIVGDSQERAYWRVNRPPPGYVSSLEQCPVPNWNRNSQRNRNKTIEECKREGKLAKEKKKGDKIVGDSQERAYWRVNRPPPGYVSSLEQCPVPNWNRNSQRNRNKTIEECKRELDLLKISLSRTRVKASIALESMRHYVETYSEYDPIISGTQPSNPWVTEDITFWQLNSPLVELLTEKRVRRWGLSMEELVLDPTGLVEFTAYLRKEYSHENIRFWTAVNELRRSSQSQIHRKVGEIFEEFLAPGAPCEINIDGKTMERVHQELKNPSRFTFDAAAEHVYALLLKKDCYPRFIRSEHYKNLLANGIQPSQKKRFFGFGATKKKSSTASAPNPSLLQQGPSSTVGCSALSKRRGSDRSLSGSAHELAISGVKDPTRVPHSHSQSNLSDIPYREPEPAPACGVCPWDEPVSAAEAELQSKVKKPSIAINPGASTFDDVCPWEKDVIVEEKTSCASPTVGAVKTPVVIEKEKPIEIRSRKNSAQLDSGSSSSDISIAIAEVSDRFRKTCGISQQQTLDGDKKGQHRKLSTASCVEIRRASVSGVNRPSVSSFEESSDKDNKPQHPISPKVFKISLKKTGSTTTPAPTISVSSVADDIPHDEEAIQGLLAPLAVPDSESPGSEVAPEIPQPDQPETAKNEGKEVEEKQTEICPWENE